MILQIIRLKSNLPEEELLKKAKEREPHFKAIPGLLQKYYVKTSDTGEYGGILCLGHSRVLTKISAIRFGKKYP